MLRNNISSRSAASAIINAVWSFLTIVNLCLAHIINLATQVLISTRSKAKHYNPHNIDEHTPDVDGIQQDELGLVRAICINYI